MFKREKFTELAKSIFKPKGVLSSTSIIHPEREWGIGLFLALIMFFLTAAWSAQTYLKYLNVDVADESVIDIKPPEYKADQIDISLNIIKSKADEYNSIVVNVKDVEDTEVIEGVSQDTNTNKDSETVTNNESDIITASGTDTAVEDVPVSESAATSSDVLIIQGE